MAVHGDMLRRWTRNELQQLGGWKSRPSQCHSCLLRCNDEIAREFHDNKSSTIAHFKKDALTFLGKNSKKNSYREHTFIPGDSILGNNSKKVRTHDWMRGITTSVRPSLSAGGKSSSNMRWLEERPNPPPSLFSWWKMLWITSPDWLLPCRRFGGLFVSEVCWPKCGCFKIMDLFFHRSFLEDVYLWQVQVQYDVFGKKKYSQL